MCFDLVDFDLISQAKWIGLSEDAFHSLITMPKFTFTGVVAIAPIALLFSLNISEILQPTVLWLERISSKIREFARTMLDGLATIAAGLIGTYKNS